MNVIVLLDNEIVYCLIYVLNVDLYNKCKLPAYMTLGLT